MAARGADAPQLLGFAFHPKALKNLAGIPHKIRAQIMRKARALQTDPYPQGCKKLHGVTGPTGEPVYRERSGDYRILYVVRETPHSVITREVIILDIDDRKDVY